MDWAWSASLRTTDAHVVDRMPNWRPIVKRRTVLILISLLTTLSACNGAADSERARNAEAVTLQHTEVWSNGNMELISKIYAKDYVGHFPGGMTVTGREKSIVLKKASGMIKWDMVRLFIW